jgi:uncharacterized protein (DUF2384 family)
MNEKLINDLYAIFDHWIDLGAETGEVLELKSEIVKVLLQNQTEPKTKMEDLYSFGQEVFGKRKIFLKWCRRENWTLGGKRPIEVFDSEEGRARIMQILQTIEYGGVA